MNGGECSEVHEEAFDSVERFAKVMMLTSSVVPIDQQRAQENKLVLGFLRKPLQEDGLCRILEEHFANP